MGYPSFFLNIDFGNSILSDPTANTNVTGLNYAVVMEDAEAPVQHRWTTWGVEANALLLYQAQTKKNVVMLGNNGIIYKLDEDYKTDNGTPITTTIITVPYPYLDQANDAQSMTRTHEIRWAVTTTPPQSGIVVALSLIDVDTGATVTRTVTQYTNKMDVDLCIRARQFRIKFVVTGASDFDLSYLAYTYQRMGNRKATVSI